MRRAQLQRSSHMPFREGKVTCTSCHNPHGTPIRKQLFRATVNENCYSCHAERRGPFLWEHPPVMENCANCHEAARLDQPAVAEDPDAEAVPGVPQRWPAPGVGIRKCHACRRQRNSRRVQQPGREPRLRQLPLQDSRVEPPVRELLHPLARKGGVTMTKQLVLTCTARAPARPRCRFRPGGLCRNRLRWRSRGASTTAPTPAPCRSATVSSGCRQRGLNTYDNHRNGL